MENPNEINYIIARWRDAENDPPPHGWIGLNVMASGACYYGACGYMPGDQWLDVTDEPAVPRAAVQAAVDEMTKYADEIPGTRCARGLKWARQLIKSHTGVAPTEKNQ